MMRLSRVGFFTLGLGIAAMAVGVGVAACSSSSSGGGAALTSCSTNALEILFNPMYSASDGTHMFQIPAVVNGIEGSAITWSSSNSSLVTLAPDSDTGGILITTNGAGTVNIIASAGSLCGSSPLTITQNQPTDWTIGNARYNDGNAVHFGHGPGGMGGGDAGEMTTPDAGPACTNCHGPTATNGAFNDIAHTPEQTGGFSDSDLISIVISGEVPGWSLDGGMSPDAGYFDPSIISYRAWHSFHQWSDITADEQPGIVCYLRSLTPSAQNGSAANFGGHMFGDGGMGMHRDGGGGGMMMPPPGDAGGE
jgi:hypothetical protein